MALDPHPNDSAQPPPGLPAPQLSFVFRLTATLGPPVELGAVDGRRRRIVPLTAGTFDGPDLRGVLEPGASADWQTLLADGTALGDIRYTLRTERGDWLDVRSQSVRHGRPEVLARLGRGEAVDPAEYTFRAATSIVSGAPDLAGLTRGVFVTVGGRQPAGVVYDTYLVS